MVRSTTAILLVLVVVLVVAVHTANAAGFSSATKRGRSQRVARGMQNAVRSVSTKGPMAAIRSVSRSGLKAPGQDGTAAGAAPNAATPSTDAARSTRGGGRHHHHRHGSNNNNMEHNKNNNQNNQKGVHPTTSSPHHQQRRSTEHTLRAHYPRGRPPQVRHRGQKRGGGRPGRRNPKSAEIVAGLAHSEFLRQAANIGNHQQQQQQQQQASTNSDQQQQTKQAHHGGGGLQQLRPIHARRQIRNEGYLPPHPISAEQHAANLAVMAENARLRQREFRVRQARSQTAARKAAGAAATAKLLNQHNAIHNPHFLANNKRHDSKSRRHHNANNAAGYGHLPPKSLAASNQPHTPPHMRANHAGLRREKQQRAVSSRHLVKRERGPFGTRRVDRHARKHKDTSLFGHTRNTFHKRPHSFVPKVRRGGVRDTQHHRSATALKRHHGKQQSSPHNSHHNANTRRRSQHFQEDSHVVRNANAAAKRTVYFIRIAPQANIPAVNEMVNQWQSTLASAGAKVQLTAAAFNKVIMAVGADVNHAALLAQVKSFAHVKDIEERNSFTPHGRRQSKSVIRKRMSAENNRRQHKPVNH